MKPIEFGDYRLEKKLASGGMGEVFLAKQAKGAGFERFVAIKRILPELSGDDEFVHMFLDEARLAAKLNHPNVVQIYDLGICGDQYYIAMEFLEGRDLRRVMGRLGTQRKALPIAHAVQIIHGAAEGLHYAHKLTDAYGDPLNIIHRDVSPQNVFVTFHGTIKVLDFGIAKAEARSVQTRTGGLKGKYPYLSPEQVRGDHVDGRSDVFSLGTVLWEITVGRRLFKRDNDLLTLKAVVKGEIPPPSKLFRRYPRELEQIVMKSLARNVDERYSNCRELQEDLEQFVGNHGLVLSPQKMGTFVEGLFPDEPRTVTDILEEVKRTPRSKSLLKDEEPSESFSNAGDEPSSSRDEHTEPSSSAVDLQLLALATGDGDSDGSASHSVIPQAEPFIQIATTEDALAEMFPDVDIDVDGLQARSPEPVGKAAHGGSENLGGEESSSPSHPPFSSAYPSVTPSASSVTPSRPSVTPSRPSVTPSRPSVTPSNPPNLDEESLRAIASVPTSVGQQAVQASSGVDSDNIDYQVQAIARAPTAVGNQAALPPLPEDLEDEEENQQASGVVVSSELGLAAEPEKEESSLTPPASTTSPKGPLEFVRRHAVFVASVVVILLAVPVFAFLLASLSSENTTTYTDRTSTGNIIPPVSPPPPTPPPTPQPIAVQDASAPNSVAPGDSQPPLSVGADAGQESMSAATDASGLDAGEAVDADSSSATPAQSGQSAATGELNITTVPEGLIIRVDGRRVGTSNARVEVPTGRRRISVRSRSQGINYSMYVTVAPGERRSERVTVPQGMLALNIRPYARVFVAGRSLGLTPMPPVRLYAGRHRVRLVNDSLNHSVTRTVTIRGGQRTTLSVDMNAR